MCLPSRRAFLFGYAPHETTGPSPQTENAPWQTQAASELVAEQVTGRAVPWRVGTAALGSPRDLDWGARWVLENSQKCPSSLSPIALGNDTRGDDWRKGHGDRLEVTLLPSGPPGPPPSVAGVAGLVAVEEGGVTRHGQVRGGPRVPRPSPCPTLSQLHVDRGRGPRPRVLAQGAWGARGFEQTVPRRLAHGGPSANQMF